VVGAGGAERGRGAGAARGKEVEDDGVVGEVPTIGLSVEAIAADGRERGAALARRSSSGSARSRPAGAEGLGLAVLGDVLLGGVDDPERVGLGLFAGVAPRGDAVAAEDAADRLRVLLP
jgi:hypothetical protein